MTFDDMCNAAVHVMDNVKMPKSVFNRASAIIFVKATEAGLIFSGTEGGGLIFRRTDTGWSQPAALAIIHTAGAGLVAGYAEKDTVICLNRAAAENFMVGEFKFDLGVDLGAAIGYWGGSAEAGVGFSDAGGAAAAMVYTFQQGVLLNVELKFGVVANYKQANLEMYGTENVKRILDGSAKAKEPAKIEELIKKVGEFTTKTE